VAVVETCRPFSPGADGVSPTARAARSLIAALALGGAVPAAAQQVSGSLSVESDLRLRGYSLSAGRPVASARVGLDSTSGFYADGSATVVLGQDDGLRFLGYQVDAGVVERVGDLWTVDFGIARNHFRAAYRGAYPYSYTEGYFGATHGALSAYVFVSPDYYRRGNFTIYGQVEGSVTPAENWRLTAHLGSLVYLSTAEPYASRGKTRYDWRLGVARELGPVEVHAALSGGGPGRQYYYRDTHSMTAVSAGASVSF
jgi:uncharacterized protein (TIGR02001 family)